MRSHAVESAAMVPEIRRAYNAEFTPERYAGLLRDLDDGALLACKGAGGLLGPRGGGNVPSAYKPMSYPDAGPARKRGGDQRYQLLHWLSRFM